jgi:hypothetical protein
MGDVVKFRSRRQRGRGPAPPPGAATTPNRPAPVYRAVDGFPVHWRDSFGTIHACEVTEPRPGARIAWTICGKDVTDNAEYVSENLNEVNCVKCTEWRWEPCSANDDPPAIWLPDYKPKD